MFKISTARSHGAKLCNRMEQVEISRLVSLIGYVTASLLKLCGRIALIITLLFLFRTLRCFPIVLMGENPTLELKVMNVFLSTLLVFLIYVPKLEPIHQTWPRFHVQQVNCYLACCTRSLGLRISDNSFSGQLDPSQLLILSLIPFQVELDLRKFVVFLGSHHPLSH